MFKDRGNPNGLFNLPHILLIITFLLMVIVFLTLSLFMKKEKIKKVTKISTVIITILEAVKIAYNFIYGYFSLTYWLPLSYCAIFILAMYFSAFGKGKVEKIGDSFIAGAFIPGLIFIIFPLTSLTEVPFYHFLALYSYLYHSAMLYFGLLYIIKIVRIDKEAFVYHGILVVLYSCLAIFINHIFDINLMFVSKPSDIPIEFVYNFLNKLGKFYSLFIIYVYVFFPYLFAYILSCIIKKKPQIE